MSWGGTSVTSHAIPGIQGFVKTNPIIRFANLCRFEPETGCVIWTGAKCWGRGKSIRYGSFKDKGKTHLVHRWSAKNIHGLDIDGLQVDHCCPNIPLPNHLCVEHVQAITGDYNRWLQTERRRHFVHLQVGLSDYYEIYGSAEDLPVELIPFYDEPEWLKQARLAT
jgi:hypothetical protein